MYSVTCLKFFIESNVICLSFFQIRNSEYCTNRRAHNDANLKCTSRAINASSAKCRAIILFLWLVRAIVINCVFVRKYCVSAMRKPMRKRRRTRRRRKKRKRSLGDIGWSNYGMSKLLFFVFSIRWVHSRSILKVWLCHTNCNCTCLEIRNFLYEISCNSYNYRR